MPALTTRNLLGEVIQFHRSCVEKYETASARVEDSQVTALLKYLAAHERRLATNIEQYEQHASAEVLATWFPFSASLEIGAHLDIPDSISVEDTVALALQLDELVVQFCRTISDQSQAHSIRELFASIAAQEEALKRQAVLAAVELIQD